MIRTQEMKLNVYDGSPGELYDLRRDPGEFHNLIDDPDYANHVKAIEVVTMDNNRH